MSPRLIGRTGRSIGIDSVVNDLLLVGAEPSSDLRIVAEGVSRRHARVWRQDADYWVEDLGSTNGTFLNGSRVARDRLRHLDVVTLGRAVELIFLNRPGGEAPAARAGIAEASFKWETGPDAGTTVVLHRGETTIGRAEVNTVVVDRTAVSKVHARLVLTAEQLLIEDLASANGTFVNEERVLGPTPLADADRVSLAGQMTFRMSVVRHLSSGPVSRDAPTSATPIFDAEWRTRLVWSAEEISIVERERARAVQEAAMRLGAIGPEERAPVDDEPRSETEPVPLPVPGLPTPTKTSAGPAVAQALPAAVLEASQSPRSSPKDTVAEGRDVLPVPANLQQAIGRETPPAGPDAAAGGRTASPVSPVRAGGVPAAVLVGAAGDLDSSGAAPAAAPIDAIGLVAADTTYRLGPGEHLLGRSPDCAIQLNSPEISRQHARLRVEAAHVEVEDLGSGNGTIVNGRKVAGSTRLADGDILAIGDFAFRIEIARGQVPTT